MPPGECGHVSGRPLRAACLHGFVYNCVCVVLSCTVCASDMLLNNWTTARLALGAGINVVRGGRGRAGGGGCTSHQVAADDRRVVRINSRETTVLPGSRSRRGDGELLPARPITQFTLNQLACHPSAGGRALRPARNGHGLPSLREKGERRDWRHAAGGAGSRQRLQQVLSRAEAEGAVLLPYCRGRAGQHQRHLGGDCHALA